VAVDYFAVGVIGYECMYGKRPYVGKNRKEIRDHILSKQVQIRRNEVPPGWSLEAADFINKLIQRKPINRLGLNGPEEVKNHVWFKDYRWDAKYTNSEWKDNNEEQMRQNSLLLRRASVQALFNGYYHDDKIQATQKNPNVIEEHVPQGPSVNSSTTNEQSNNNSGMNMKKGGAGEDNSSQSSSQQQDYKDSSRRAVNGPGSGVSSGGLNLGGLQKKSSIRQDSFSQI
jgi:Protein kinase domain